MSITILRSYGIELLIRQNAITPALRNTIFIMQSLAQHHYSPSFSYPSWHIVHILWASCSLSVTPGWVSISVQNWKQLVEKPVSLMELGKYGIAFDSVILKPFVFFLLLHSIMTCLVYRFRSMSIPILRSYSIALLIRLLNLTNPALPNTIFTMRRLNTIALILTLFFKLIRI